MKEIEDKFQALAECIIAGTLCVIGTDEQKIINDFFQLLVFRTESRANPLPDQFLSGIEGLDYNLTKDEQELLGKNGIGFIRPDFTIPGRLLTGINIQRNIIRTQRVGAQWGIFTASAGEFIVPDSFGNINVVPLSPTHCLLCLGTNPELSHSELVTINREAVHSSREYYFARDLSRCPL
jgi:hypothetical protein